MLFLAPSLCYFPFVKARSLVKVPCALAFSIRSLPIRVDFHSLTISRRSHI